MAMSSASMQPVGVTGVIQYGGILYHDDYDRAWRGLERDKTIRAMINDPLIGGVLHAIEMLVRGVDWYVTPADEQDAESVEIATFVQECLDDMEGMWPGDALSEMMSYLPWGWYVAEVVYKWRRGDNRDPSLRSSYTDGRIGWQGWYTRAQQTRLLWHFDERERAIGMQQQKPSDFRTIDLPLSKCIHLVYADTTGSPEGRTPLRSAYDAWYYKHNIQKIEAIGIERDLAGLPVMRVPSRDIEQRTETFVVAQQAVTNIRNDSQAGMVLSSQRDDSGNYMQTVELLSTGGERAFDTDTIIKRYANEVVAVFLANVMRTGQDGVGSYALAETQSGLFIMAIGAHLDVIANAINEQAMRPLVALNGWPVEKAPVVNHSNIENADLQRVGMYLQNLHSAGLLVDTPALRAFVHELAGFPVPELAELERVKAEEDAASAALRERLLGAGAGEETPDEEEDEQEPDEGEPESDEANP